MEFRWWFAFKRGWVDLGYWWLGMAEVLLSLLVADLCQCSVNEFVWASSFVKYKSEVIVDLEIFIGKNFLLMTKI